jgi:hypothetical protein
MNDIPIMWAQELKAAYPAKSGPVGWASTKLLLALRRALMESTWTEIIDGCKRYKAYCQSSGAEGTEFVQNPLRFISDGCHLEEFVYTAPKDPKIAAHEAQTAERWDRASRLANDLSVARYRGDSIETFEGRISAAQNGGLPEPSPGRTEHPLSSRIADLASRMRIAK